MLGISLSILRCMVTGYSFSLEASNFVGLIYVPSEARIYLSSILTGRVFGLCRRSPRSIRFPNNPAPSLPRECKLGSRKRNNCDLAVNVYSFVLRDMSLRTIRCCSMDSVLLVVLWLEKITCFPRVSDGWWKTFHPVKIRLWFRLVKLDLHEWCVRPC